jgi:hypothetical protein
LIPWHPKIKKVFPVVCCLLFVVCWLLVVGCWLLVVVVVVDDSDYII